MPSARNADGTRQTSCCSDKDCYPTEIRKVSGKLFAQSHDGLRWVLVPEHLIEQNNDDARESPDGSNHVCMNSQDIIYCFTYGGGL